MSRRTGSGVRRKCRKKGRQRIQVRHTPLRVATLAPVAEVALSTAAGTFPPSARPEELRPRES
eukprot:9134553-Alexandrium_andersonii.AAC.2